jgi:hypothetical protein
MSQKVQTDEFPPRRAIAVTPSSTALPEGCRGLRVGTGGNLVVEYLDAPGVAVTLRNTFDGAYEPGAFIKVLSATTADHIVALY